MVSEVSDSDELRANKPEKESAEIDRVRSALQPWLSSRMPDCSDVKIGKVSAPGESGFSSETMIVDASWLRDGSHEEDRLVFRCRPEGFTVFEHYDMELQFRCMRMAGEVGVPVPETLWHEPDESILGQSFLVMRAVEGRVPPDSPPYTIHGFLLEATSEQRHEAYFSVLEAIANLHTLNAANSDLAFLDRGRFGKPGLEQELGYYRNYIDWIAEGREQPTVVLAFEQLTASLPDPSEPVFSWGDARFGNVMFETDGFRPVALFDWEMASLAPREQDVGWFLFFPKFFSEAVGLPPLDGVPSDAECVAHYEKCAGVELGDIEWWIRWASVRHAAILARLADKNARAGIEMDGFTFSNNFATRILATLMDLPQPK